MKEMNRRQENIGTEIIGVLWPLAVVASSIIMLELSGVDVHGLVTQAVDKLADLTDAGVEAKEFVAGFVRFIRLATDLKPSTDFVEIAITDAVQAMPGLITP